MASSASGQTREVFGVTADRCSSKRWSQLGELGPEILHQAVAELHPATMRVLRQSRLLRLEILKESIGFANRPHYLVRSREFRAPHQSHERTTGPGSWLSSHYLYVRY